ncbi:unnamed protein product [Phaedon cochleariae]|uniref:Uncharacterized protein n=1 Tax=Phaedon cochleariae TaxID=80249 RepID=A0A9N9X3F6_PHACE|nr:unnamed protein product [Phaedon cochleariae]
MCCDSVEESGKEVISNVYILHETVDNPIVKNELLLLAECEERWRPIFSAAGFFEVNQSCIASIFSALITHVVIIIQFNMVLQDDDMSTGNNITITTTKE